MWVLLGQPLCRLCEIEFLTFSQDWHCSDISKVLWLNLPCPRSPDSQRVGFDELITVNCSVLVLESVNKVWNKVQNSGSHSWSGKSSWKLWGMLDEGTGWAGPLPKVEMSSGEKKFLTRRKQP